MPRAAGESLKPLWILAGVVGLILVYGIVGFRLLGFGLVDAVYMTVLALTTLGFGDGRELGTTGKLFTVSLVIIGVTAFFAALAALATAVVEGRIRLGSWRRRMERKVGSLRNHYIICAYGRVGRAVAREFEAQELPFVVIDIKEELEEQMRSDGVLFLIGDPALEPVLRLAGVERARGLICAVDSDAINVYLTVLARALNPGIFIVARAGEPQSPQRLYRAGADRVVSPYVMAGRHMSLLALRPQVVDYLDLVGRGHWKARLDELLVEEDSPLAGRTVRDACGEATSLLLVRASGETIPNPRLEEILRPGDAVVLYSEFPVPRRAERG